MSSIIHCWYFSASFQILLLFYTSYEYTIYKNDNMFNKQYQSVTIFVLTSRVNLESRMSNHSTNDNDQLMIHWYFFRKWTLFYSITVKIHFTFIIYVIFICKKFKNSMIYKWFITYIQHYNRMFHCSNIFWLLYHIYNFDFSLIYLISLIKLFRLLSRFLIPGNVQC